MKDPLYLKESDSYSAALETLPTGIPLPYPVYLRFQSKLLLFRRKGDVLTLERKQHLQQSGVDTLYLHRSDWLGFIHSIEEFANPSSPTEEYLSHIRNVLLAYGRLLEEQTGLKIANLTKVQSLVAVIVSAIDSSPPLANSLLRKYKDPAMYYSNHNINVAIYSIVLGRFMRWPQSELRSLATSCMLHNVGNLFVPQKLLYKAGKLTTREFDQVKPHTEMGAQALRFLELDKSVIQTAREHHERVDGKGYPNRLLGTKIHPFAKVCSIVDVYDALTNFRPHFTPVPPGEAVQLMQAMQGKFDPTILRIIPGSRKKKAA